MAQKNKRGLVIAIVALVLAALLGTWYILSGEKDTAGDPPAPSPASSSAAPASPSPADGAEQCDPMGAGFVPTEFEMPGSKTVTPVLSLGRDANDAAAAPPKDQSHTTGWFNEGPMAGSTQGKIVLTIHTYRNGGALGNEMYEDGPKKVKEGDRMILRDENGNVACYTVSGIEKIWVKDYDPESDAIYDWDGDPKIAVVICWDYNDEAQDWDSRIVYYADPVDDGASGSDRTEQAPKPNTQPSAPPSNAPESAPGNAPSN
ncbi:class F sortase [Enemella sp. A6]|uniref:class F sortase n=1 Tax=Enemella sp. A6 TaxID=3440152 RepID=UPI003EBE1399